MTLSLSDKQFESLQIQIFCIQVLLLIILIGVHSK